MSKLRRKFITVLAVLFCALLALSTALFIPKTEKRAQAAAVTTLQNDIVYTDTHFINGNGLKDLFTALTGSNTYSAVENLFTSTKTAYTAAELTTKKGSEYNVLFGGKKWIPAYLSRTNGTTGDIILTLWLAESFGEAQWAARTGSSTNSASGTYKQSYSGKYPAAMYSTSYIRAYINGTDSDGQTPLKYSDADNNLVSIGSSYNSYWVKFIRDYSNYIVVPNAVSWQGTESTTEITTPFSINGDTSESNTYCRPNDAWGTPNNANWKKDSVTGTTVDTYLLPRDYYTDWAADKLWLASLAEAVEGGLWNLSNNQRGGSSNTGLRSGGPGNGATVYCFNVNGACSYHSNGNSATRSKETYNIRPAFHFNITKAMQLAPADVETTYTGNDLGVTDIFGVAPDDIPWYNSSVYSKDANINYIDYAYQLNNDPVSSVLNAGTYKAAMTFNSNSIGFTWKSPDTPNGGTKTINITVKKKPVKVKFTSQPTVTTGVEAQYPTVTYDSKQIAANDDVGGDRYSTHYPKLQIRYKNADSDTRDYDSTVKPTLPGKYIAIAEIDMKDANENNKIINYEIITDGGADRISFEVKAIGVDKPTLQYGKLTYNAEELTVNILGLPEDNEETPLIKYSVAKKNGATIISDRTANSFTVVDAGEYVVTFSFADDEKDTHIWSDATGGNASFELTFEVGKKQLTLNLEGVDNDDGVDFDKGEWGPDTEVNFKVNIEGVVEGQSVTLKVYYTEKDSSAENPLGALDGIYTLSNLAIGEYKLYCELATGNSVNANYEIKFENKTRLEKTIKVVTAKSKFKESDLSWVYTNDGNEVAITSGTHVTYNGKEFKISLKNTFSELEKLGVKVETKYGDEGFDGELSATNASDTAYTVTVKITALNESYEFEEKIFTFTWYIDRATYDLNTFNVTWGYRARNNEASYPSGGVQYEGGAAAGDDGYIDVFIKEGLDGFVVKYSGAHQSAVGTYTAKITSLTHDNPNYNEIDIDDLPEPVGWLTLDWEITKRTLSTANWTAADYENEKVTKAPKLLTSYYSPVLAYKYYTSADRSEELTFSQLTYSEGIEKIYYVEVFIDNTDETNFKSWALGGQDNPHEFKVGKAKAAVEITITAGGVYDGTAKAAELEILNNVDGIDLNSFEIKYYRAGSDTALDGAPKDAGNYSAVVSLKSDFTEKFYIKGDNTFDFTIAKRILEIPKYDGSLTYDGTERDVAKLCGLPDGWENYIDITIAGTGGNTDTVVRNMGRYSVTFSIKNGINTTDIRNVEWNTDSSVAKTIPQIVYIDVEQLELNAKSWHDNKYYSRIEFEEENAENFLVYKVYNENGAEVDYGTVLGSVGEMFTVEVTVGTEHGDNVVIKFASGVSARFEFYTDGGQTPTEVALPTIADLTFNGENQTFVVNYGEFEQYIEIDLSLSDVSVLSQFNAGEYTVYFKIKSGQNAVWASTGDRKSIAVTFKMKVLVLEEPQVKSGERFTYNGTEQSATLNIDAAILARFMKIEGDYTATNAGEYTFTLSIDPSFAGNVAWASAQGADAVKTVEWTIEKARVSVKWTQSGDVPELDIPEEFKDLDVEYVITDENGNVVSPDQMEAGKTYTVTAKLKESSEANYEFVDDSGKSLSTATDGFGFEFKSGKSPFPWWIIAVAAGALLLILALVIIVVKKRQTADGDDEFDDYYGDEYDYDEEVEEDFDDEDF